MKRQITSIFLTLVLALDLGCAMLRPMQPQARFAATSQVVARMPAPTSAEAEKLSADLVRLGPAQLQALCRTLEPWSGSDVKLQYALAGLTVYASRPGAEADRKLVAGAFVKALKSASSDEVKAFLIRQLERAGKDEAVAPLAAFLADDRLCAPATQALIAINTPKAQAALIRALSSAKTPARRVTLLQAVGVLRSPKAARPLLKAASSEDAAVRLEAWYGLANLGLPGAEPVLARAAREAGSAERAKAVSFYLLYARRRAQAGQPDVGVRLCRQLLDVKLTPANQHDHCAALATLAEILGPRVMPDLLLAADSESLELRAAALRIATAMPGPQATAPWLNKLAQTQSPTVRLEILRMLGDRGDRAALPAVLSALQDRDPELRQTAIAVAGKLGGPEAFAALVRQLQTGTEPGDLDAVKNVLLRTPSKEYLQPLADAYPQASTPGKVRILQILGARQASQYAPLCFSAAADGDREVRLAALKSLRDLAGEQELPRILNQLLAARDSAESAAARNAVAGVLERCQDREAATAQVMKAYARAGGPLKPDMLDFLPRLGGAPALQAARAQAGSSVSPIREAAVRALADWPDAGPMPELLKLAQNTPNQKLRVIAFRGYVRMIGTTQKLTEAEKIELCRKAVAAAPSREEVKPLLATLSTLPRPESLRIAVSCLKDPALRQESALAAIAIAPQIARDNPKEVRSAMKQILASAPSRTVRNKAQKILNELEKSDKQ